MQKNVLPAACVALLLATAAQAQSDIETVQVTATRVPESVGDVPADVSLVPAEELQERQVHTLASALALTAGVEAPPGGDAGPSSAVPSFWGLHEFDDFLLVQDGVPWGGAYNPTIPDITFNDVQRVEVLKGAAPVAFGATSFVGVIQVLHYPAGEAENDIEAAGGNYDSVRADGSIALPDWGDWRHSIAADFEKLGFADKREEVKDGHLLYRAATPLGAGTLRLDANISIVSDVPASPVVREGDALTMLTPLNANYNPANAKIDERRFQVSLGYEAPTTFGDWSTLISFAHSDIDDIRGFLRADLTNGPDANADSQAQHRLLQDGYADTHLTHKLADNMELVLGADLLLGLGRQRSLNGEYFAPLSGLIIPPPTTAIHVDEINTIRDTRVFGGQYAEFDWHPVPALDLLAGLRMNETGESKSSGHIDTLDPTADESERATRDKFRLSGMVGASYQAWKDGADEAVLYADYRNAFKPAAIDFGPDYTPDVLNPETAQSYEMGVKGALLDGRLSYDAEAFLLDFRNLLIATTDAN
ncbi:MAG TPA: TonB-dependent receptor, partial [Rhizomicrobium sp.]|nr:TonB-dependent receptor [Rhizomicrobium sp.]